jgi:hypothetical protein
MAEVSMLEQLSAQITTTGTRKCSANQRRNYVKSNLQKPGLDGLAPELGTGMRREPHRD